MSSVRSLLAPAEQAAELLRRSVEWPSWILTHRQLCDLELLLNGGFAPLSGFMEQADYRSVVESMRLANGAVWTIPITLGVSTETAAAAEKAGWLSLREPDGTVIAAIEVRDVWQPDRRAEAKAVFGTTEGEHEGVALFLSEPGDRYIGGPVRGVAAPEHFDYREFRKTPEQLRAEFARRGWTRVVGFQTRNPMHRSHFELTVRAAQAANAKLLLHPVVGATRPGDVDHYTRVRCYQAVLPRYRADQAMLSLLPLAMRMAGPREAVWHALIRRNYGCTHFVVGRDHAGPGRRPDGTPFYQPYEAQQLARQVAGEIGIDIVSSEELVYLADRDEYVETGAVPSGAQVSNLSGTELRRRLEQREEIPAWFTFPEVAAELRRSTDRRQGCAILLTGLPAAGKSTIARHLVAQLGEAGRGEAVLLDGDLIRRTVSQGLGFSRADREEHLRRIARLALDVVKRGGVAVCPVVAPYESAREEMRKTIEQHGQFLLVYVATPIEVCEGRDPKGLYRGARAGTVKHFTGVSDPYEPPLEPDIVIGTQEMDPATMASVIRGKLDMTD